MRDKFLTLIQACQKNPARLRREVGLLRETVALSTLPVLCNRISQTSKHAGLILMLPKKPQWKFLGGRPFFPAISLEREIVWRASQLGGLLARLNAHLAAIRMVESAFCEKNYAKALELLEQHFEFHGPSIWNMQSRIACMSRLSEDGELVAVFLEQLARDLPHSLSVFLGYQFADLYDQGTTFGGFRNRIERHVSNAKNQPLLCQYLTAKFLKQDTSPQFLSQFLNIESEFSYIDSYNALMEVAVSLLAKEDFESSYAGLIRHFEVLANLRDPRLSNLLDGGNGDQNIISWEKADCFKLPGESLERIGVFLEVDGACGSEILVGTEQLIGEAILGLDRPDVDLREAYKGLNTTISKLDFLPWARAFDLALDGLFFSIALDDGYLRCAGSSIRDISPQIAEPEVETSSSKKSLLSKGVASHPWAILYSIAGENGHAYMQAIVLSKNKQFDEAIALLDTLHAKSAMPAYGANLLKIEILCVQGKEAEALKLCVLTAINRESAALFLPIRLLVGNAASFEDLKDFDLVDLIVGLYFLSQHSRNTKDQFHLEFACRTLLNEHGCLSLVSLADHFPATDERISFILWKVFTSANLRLVRFLRSADDYEEARLALVPVLLDRRKSDVQQILDEVRSLLLRRELRDAENDIECTRIAVNSDAVRSWADDNFREQFLRIKKSKTARSAPTVEQIQSALAELSSGKLESHSATVSSNLQDPLFVLGSEIFRAFFLKEGDGLDHFLSLRIRHGSLVGYLRAPLERARLIAQGAYSGDGELASYWRGELSGSNALAVGKVLDAIGAFQFEYDKMVEEFRSCYLQITSEKSPLGLFKMGLPKVGWDAYHVQWEAAASFEVFFDDVWMAFRTSLELSLESVCLYIDEQLLVRSEELIRELNRAVDSSGLFYRDRATVITAINEGTKALQEAFAVVKRWFVFNESPWEASGELEFDKVLDVALGIYRKSRPSFDISVEKVQMPDDVRFERAIVPRLTDALFIMLDNVSRHCGLAGEAVVRMYVEWLPISQAKGSLSITVENQLGATIDTNNTNRKLADIREQIETDRGVAALAREGGSGLIKLARIARGADEHLNPLVEFGCCEKSRVFRVTANIRLGYQQQALETQKND